MKIELNLSYKDYFAELLAQAQKGLGFNIQPQVQSYLINLLEFHSLTSNLYPQEHKENGQKNPTTLAEMWLTAHQSEQQQRFELIKQVGDRALYIGGYFTESLNRKAIDIEYYSQMGQSAFSFLASHSADQFQSRTFNYLAVDFNRWLDILSFIANQQSGTPNASLLKIYERYLKTGSDYAYHQLVEHGVVTLSQDQLKKSHQDE